MCAEQAGAPHLGGAEVLPCADAFARLGSTLHISVVREMCRLGGKLSDSSDQLLPQAVVRVLAGLPSPAVFFAAPIAVATRL